ncbi:MAG TPA: MTH1187 family thiamine-binding protein [bacterium]|nr:MTH1187 family thiamine-binding protein [bacterium]
MAILAISVTPIGTGSPSVGAYVADALGVIERSGLRYQPRAMHTEVEGGLEELLALVPAIHRACFARGVLRLSTVIKIDDRRDAPSSIEGKVRSVVDRIPQP